MRKGVTLLELLIVVLIIGILATISVPKYQNMRVKAKLAEAYMALDAIKIGQETYYMENGHYATEIPYLDIEIPLRNERQFDYGTRTGVGLVFPDGSVPSDGNDYTNKQIYTTMVTDQNHANELAPDNYHPHNHEKGVIGIWKASDQPHSHGDYTHTHVDASWEDLP